MLNDMDIRKAINVAGMISGFKNLDVQLQANGFDLTLDTVDQFNGTGAIDFDNKNRVLCDLLDNYDFELAPGAYLFHTAETLKMPPDVAAIGVPRSTMSRNGAFVESAAIDAGYEGKLVFPVLLTRPLLVYDRARFVQLLFFRLSGPAEKVYAGIYMRAKIGYNKDTERSEA